jgi:anion-transporting  ArsA/GET3 family ATPase
MGYLQQTAPIEVQMNEENQKEEQELESAPYKGAYRNELEDEPIVDTEEEDTQQEATPQAKTDSFVEKTESEEPKHDYKKRYDDLKKHYDAKIEEFKGKETELLTLAKQASDGGINYKPPKTPEELEKFKEEYPDVYNVIESVAYSQADNKTKNLQSEVEELKKERVQLTKQKAEQELLRSHPDFMTIKSDEEFISWLEEQPPSIADGVLKNNTDAKWASRVLDLYKADKGIKRTSKQKANSAADYVPTKKKAEPSKGKKRMVI